MVKRAIIISASSDIGNALASAWLENGWEVCGTYRTRTTDVDDLEARGASLVHCDLDSSRSISEACTKLNEQCANWDILLMGPGVLDPIGPFSNASFVEWERSINVNFTSQMRIVHELLPSRNRSSSKGARVLLMAGGGTNNAPLNYSAYTVSKIALIKMCELLDAEIQGTSFVIFGPGWVKTKIHGSTLRAGERAGANYEETMRRLESEKLTPMDRIIEFCDWALDAPREVVSGRNFSVVHDPWGSYLLDEMLLEDNNAYKLRRSKNGWSIK